MFEKVYKKVDSKVQPSLELINETKQKMYKEINNSNKIVHMNFYKYATIAACLIIFIGVLAPNMSKDLVVNESFDINESVNDSYKEITENNFAGNPFNSALDSVMTSDSVTSATVSRNSIFDSISEFFENIIQWFKELLF
ncbi:MAG: hypothetical protein E7314_03585 [Clostridiales bacterium]|nr:hypothetical protein [Clostridiales bacterium]